MKQLLLIAALVLGALAPVRAQNGQWPDAAETGWYDAKHPQTAYTLHSAEQLAGLATLVGGGNSFTGTTFTLDADIDLSARYWAPIGTVAHPFGGSFDGGGHTVSGLYIGGDGTGYQGTGLIGYYRPDNTCNADMSIRNLTLDGGSITGGDSEKIPAINIDGTYSGIYAGALVGCLYITKKELTIEHCFNRNVSVTGGNAQDYAHTGGLVGWAYCEKEGSITITGCCSTGDVTGGKAVKKTYTGGIVATTNGYNGNGRASIANVYAAGHVVGGDANIAANTGGIVGLLSNSLSDSYATGSVAVGPSHSSVTGGIVGEGGRYIFNCLFVPPAGSIDNIAGDGANSGNYTSITDATESSSNNSLWDGRMTSAPILFDAADGGGWDTTVWDIDPAGKRMPLLKNISGQTDIANPIADFTNRIAGAGTAGDPFLIRNADDLAWIRKLINLGAENWQAANYKIADGTDTLDLSALDWKPIGNRNHPFRGSFDGNGCVVEGMHVEVTDAGDGYYGFFGSIRPYNNDISIRNLTLDGGSITAGEGHAFGNYVLGALAGEIYPDEDEDGSYVVSIENCHAGNIRISGGEPQDDTPGSDFYMGGLIGYVMTRNDSIALHNCDAACHLDATTADYAAFGGLIGFYSGYAGSLRIDGCHAAGSIEVKTLDGKESYAGGITGWLDEYGHTTITDCYSTTDITVETESGAKAYTGGIAGIITDQGKPTGDLIHAWEIQYMLGGYSIYDIEKGLVEISNVYAAGSITGGTSADSYTGGLTGEAYSAGIIDIRIRDSYAAGTITGNARPKAFTGGICGDAFSSGQAEISVGNCLAVAANGNGDTVRMHAVGNQVGTGTVALTGNYLVPALADASADSVWSGVMASAPILLADGGSKGWDTSVWDIDPTGRLMPKLKGLEGQTDIANPLYKDATTPATYVDVYIDLQLADPALRDHIGLNPIEGRTQAVEGQPFELTVWEDAYTDGSNLSVAVDGQSVEPFSTTATDSTARLQSSSQWTHTLSYRMDIAEGSTITLRGIAWNNGQNPTGSLPNPSEGGATVTTAPGYIIITQNGERNTENGLVSVYTMTGQLYYASSPWGRSGGASLSIPAKPGAYIVSIGNQRWKVFVR